MLFFERSDKVADHRGEICFPGGSVEAHDDGPVEAALREAYEELGLQPQAVHVVGLLDDVETIVSNFTITPVVGHIEDDPVLVLDTTEVARVVRVPMRRLLEPGVQQEEVVDYQSKQKLRYSFRFDGNLIWGATARILHSLMTLLDESQAP